MGWDRPPQGDRAQDLQEIFDKLKSQFDSSSFFFKKPVWLIIAAIAIFVVALNSYYTVEPQETAVVQRFGRFVRTTEAGLHFKWPLGIETVKKVLTGRVMQREYGYRTLQSGVRSRFTEKGYEEESRMLSGDLNVVDLQWAVQYKIENPTDYLFQVKDVEATMDDISESVVRRIVGNRYADEVLTVGRASIATMAQEEIQKILDEYKTGLRITTVKLQNANPPEPVKAAFNEVNEARQEKERMINEAQEAYNNIIPKARGQARQVITQAEGYKLERINRSLGQTKRFEEVLKEYKKAPDVTQYRMYLETLDKFFGRVARLIVLEEEQRNILPFLDLSGPMKASKQQMETILPPGPDENLRTERNQ